MTPYDDERDAGLKKAIEVAGGTGMALAEKLGLTRAAVYRWKRIPAERVVHAEKALGIPREVLRPDLYEK